MSKMYRVVKKKKDSLLSLVFLHTGNCRYRYGTIQICLRICTTITIPILRYKCKKIIPDPNNTPNKKLWYLTISLQFLGYESYSFGPNWTASSSEKVYSSQLQKYNFIVKFDFLFVNKIIR